MQPRHTTTPARPQAMACQRWFGWRLPASMLLAIVACLPARANEDPAPAGDSAAAVTLEYQVKAGFLFNFAKFVEWPTNTPTEPGKFRIGIVDDGRAYPVIAGVLAGKSVRNKVVETRRFKPGEDVTQCDLLFIARSAEKQVDEMLKAVGKAPVLTVSEVEGFAGCGGCINFVRKGENIRFEVNLKTAERAGLKVSSKVAGMATVVRGREEGQ